MVPTVTCLLLSPVHPGVAYRSNIRCVTSAYSALVQSWKPRNTGAFDEPIYVLPASSNGLSDIFLILQRGGFPESTPVEYCLCVAASLNIYSGVHLRAIQADESEVGANVLVNVLLKSATMKGMGGKSVHKMGNVINIYPPPEVIDAGEG